MIHLKTDNNPFYQYTLEVIKENNYQLIESADDLYKNSLASTLNKGNDTLAIKTFYEKKFSDLGFKICYLKFRINP